MMVQNVTTWMESIFGFSSAYKEISLGEKLIHGDDSVFELYLYGKRSGKAVKLIEKWIPEEVLI